MKQANATATTRAAADKILWLNFMFLVIKCATAEGAGQQERLALHLCRQARAKD
jgi:hypothetical protein